MFSHHANVLVGVAIAELHENTINFAFVVTIKYIRLNKSFNFKTQDMKVCLMCSPHALF